MKNIVMLSLYLLSLNAVACSFDTDCEVGSKCVKNGGMYGACMGGMYPGNSHDADPVRYSNDPTGEKGNTCSFDLDCGVGGKCVKSGIYGVCMN